MYRSVNQIPSPFEDDILNYFPPSRDSPKFTPHAPQLISPPPGGGGGFQYLVLWLDHYKKGLWINTNSKFCTALCSILQMQEISDLIKEIVVFIVMLKGLIKTSGANYSKKF